MDFTPKVPPGSLAKSDFVVYSQAEPLVLTAASAGVISGQHTKIDFVDASGAVLPELPASGYVAVYGIASITAGGAKVTGFEDCLEILLVDGTQGAVDWRPRAVAWFWGLDLPFYNRAAANQQIFFEISGPPRPYNVYVRSGQPAGTPLSISVSMFAIVQQRPAPLSPSEWINPKCCVPPFQLTTSLATPLYLFADGPAFRAPQPQVMTCRRYWQSSMVGRELFASDTDGYYMPLFGGPWNVRLAAFEVSSPQRTIQGKLFDMSPGALSSALTLPAIRAAEGGNLSLGNRSGMVQNPWGHLLVADDSDAQIEIHCSYGG